MYVLEYYVGIIMLGADDFVYMYMEILECYSNHSTYSTYLYSLRMNYVRTTYTKVKAMALYNFLIDSHHLDSMQAVWTPSSQAGLAINAEFTWFSVCRSTIVRRP